jgi:hypothetical protein
MEIDPMFMLSEVNRVSKDGASLFVTTPNVTSSRAVFKLLNGIEPYFYMQYHRDRSYHRHNYEYSPVTLTLLLEAAGYSGNVWTEDLFEDGLYGYIDGLRSLGLFLNELGDNIIAQMTKVSGVVDRWPSCVYV